MRFKRPVLVSYHAHSHEGYRSSMFHRFFLSQGVEGYEFLCANWDHITKKTHGDLGPHTKLIKVPVYEKNLSLRRVISHVVFSFKILLEPAFWKSDLLIFCVPPSFSAFFPMIFAKLRGTPFVLDVVDLWPEAIPALQTKKRALMLSIGWLWIALRNLSYRLADRIILHCQFFKQPLGLKTQYLFLPLYQSEDSAFLAPANREPLSQRITLLVLGSINNIIDVDAFLRLCAHLKVSERSIFVKILGSGENKEKLLRGLEELDIAFEDFGINYDPKLRTQILSSAHFGYNGYKSTTAIGITYKSIDFCSFGCGILNSVAGDLKDFVESEKIGFHFEPGTEKKLSEQILSLTDADFEEMSKRSRQLALNYFKKESFQSRLTKTLEDL